MKSCYVVMSTFDSPIAICIPTPKAVFVGKDAKKNAYEFCKQHNENPRCTTVYYVRAAELK